MIRRSVVLLILSLLISCSSPAAPHAGQTSAVSGPKTQTADLPVRKVVLYKNGIGYFEHSGDINGNAQVSIDFTTSQLDDALQSLTALDEGGGHISRVGYNSTSPLDQQLKSIPLGLTADPSVTDIFGALRGARVEVIGSGAPITGRLLNIEVRDQEDPKSNISFEKQYLTVISDSGAIRVLELTPSTSVRLLDRGLDQQFGRYLSLVESAREGGLRHLTLASHGEGKREMRVSYISEVPIWKSTYRIVFPEEASNLAILQGWAIVDNTVGSDWNNVQLSLVAGAPQSFVQPLSTPYYERRPEIGLPIAAMTSPQTHEGALEPMQNDRQQAGSLTGALNSPSAAQSPVIKAAPRSLAIAKGMTGGAMGGIVGSVAGGESAGGFLAGIDRASDAIQQGDISANAFDDYFEYTLNQPVTIHKNESALVPILQANVEAERVTLWSERENRPLRALWVTNSSKFTLDRGSFSIFEAGAFAGQGLLEPVHPGEKRLLSYAMDQAMHVSSGGGSQSVRLEHISFDKGVLTQSNKRISERTYILSNSAEEARTVLIQYPRSSGMKLDSNPALAETTPTLYRFKINVQPHGSASLHVTERGTISTRYSIGTQSDLHPLMLLATSGQDARVTQALRPILDAEHKLAGLEIRLKTIQDSIRQLSEDEARARENISALKGNAETVTMRRFVDDLNRDEDQLTAARKQAEDLGRERDRARDAFSESLANFNLDMDVAESA
ncbi:MAG TPA: DUF4139 domain-containing protein [Acidobacteriaceae bacterium]